MAVRLSARADPFILDDSFAVGNANTNGLTPRWTAINPAQKTLVLISLGQSLRTNFTPTLYTPTNTAVIDNFNIYDGALYPITGPMLGCSPGVAGIVEGNINARIADLFVTNGRFDRVISVPIAIDGTLIAQFGKFGVLYDRIGVALRRLAARGIAASTTGVTMAIEIGIGQSDGGAGTSQASFQTSAAEIVAKAQAEGFSGRTFVAKETWVAGVTNATIRAAQAALVDNVTFFASGDTDTLDATNRTASNIHFNDTGAAAAATLIYNAMHASGAPF